MDFPWFDLNELPVSSQSPAISSPGLDDLNSTDGAFLGSNTSNASADDEVDETANIPDLNEEGGRNSLETQVRKRELTNAERQVAYHCLLERMENGVLKQGSTRVVAGMFGVGIRSIQRLWKRARESRIHDHHNHRVRNCGRKQIEFDLERIREIPLRQRTLSSLLAHKRPQRSLHFHPSHTYLPQFRQI